MIRPKTTEKMTIVKKRPDEGPEHADGGLLVPYCHVAPGQDSQQVTRLPDLGEVELDESPTGLMILCNGKIIYRVVRSTLSATNSRSRQHSPPQHSHKVADLDMSARSLLSEPPDASRWCTCLTFHQHPPS